MARWYLIAGEASGDLHGSNLMRGLFAADPEADIRFWGGDMMASVSKLSASLILQIRRISQPVFLNQVRK